MIFYHWSLLSTSLTSDSLLNFLQYDISSSLLEVCLSKKSKSNHFLLFNLFLRNFWRLNYKRSVTLESSLDLKICSKFSPTLHFLSLSVRILFWKDAPSIPRLTKWSLHTRIESMQIFKTMSNSPPSSHQGVNLREVPAELFTFFPQLRWLDLRWDLTNCLRSGS